MTQKSIFWYTNGFTGDIGDGAAAYTESEYGDHHLANLTTDGGTAQGVISGVLNELEVSTPSANNIDVATGKAQCSYFHYFSTGIVGLAAATPGSDTGYRVVLRADWSTQTARTFLLVGGSGPATLPALTQTAGTTWEISLASFVIESGTGDIYTDASKATAGVTDERHFIVSPGSNGVLLRTFTGDGATNAFTWSGIQQDLNNLLIIGSGAGDAALANEPVAVQFNGSAAGYVSSIFRTSVAGALVTASLGNAIYAGEVTGNTTTANISDNFELFIPNYANATMHQSARGTGLYYAGGGAATRITSSFGWWQTAAAINSLTITLALGSNWTTGSRVSLYGFR